MTDLEPHDHDVPPVTIRLADATDDEALAALSELDGRLLGAAPRLVAESDGRIVAALSVTDESIVTDPFHFTLEELALLQRRAEQLGDTTCACPRRRLVKAISGLRAPAAAALAAILVAGTSVAHAAPKPGLEPGTWVGSGTLSGTGSIDGGPPSTFSGGMRFTILVGKDGTVAGAGRWTRRMVNTVPIAAVVASAASVSFSGTPIAIRYAGTAKTVMRIGDGSQTRTLAWKPLRIAEPLRIQRAGACRASGGSTFGGVTFRWSATLEGAGTCRT